MQELLQLNHGLSFYTSMPWGGYKRESDSALTSVQEFSTLVKVLTPSPIKLFRFYDFHNALRQTAWSA